jgi:hypothetical protein
MKSLAIAVTLGWFSLAAARSRPVRPTAPVQVSEVERSVGALANARLTPGFDGGFRDSVALIKRLYGQTASTRRISRSPRCTSTSITTTWTSVPTTMRGSHAQSGWPRTPACSKSSAGSRRR